MEPLLLVRRRSSSDGAVVRGQPGVVRRGATGSGCARPHRSRRAGEGGRVKGIILAGGSGTRLYPSHARPLQAALPRLRQADGLLPALDAHARGAARRPRDHDARGPVGLRAPPRRRLAVRGGDLVRGAAEARGPRAGVPDREGLRRPGRRRPRARGQPLLRPRPARDAPARREPRRGRDRLRDPRPRPAALRRRRVRRAGPRGRPRGEAAGAALELRGHGPLLLRQPGPRRRGEPAPLRPAASSRSRT